MARRRSRYSRANRLPAWQPVHYNFDTENMPKQRTITEIATLHMETDFFDGRSNYIIAEMIQAALLEHEAWKSMDYEDDIMHAKEKIWREYLEWVRAKGLKI